MTTQQKKRRLLNNGLEIWKKKAFERDEGKCQCCGLPANQVHHFYYRSSRGNLILDIDNAVSLCQKCHFILHHKDPKIIEDRIVAKMPTRRYNRLKRKAEKPLIPSFKTLTWIKEQINKLK